MFEWLEGIKANPLATADHHTPDWGLMPTVIRLPGSNYPVSRTNAERYYGHLQEIAREDAELEPVA